MLRLRNALLPLVALALTSPPRAAAQLPFWPGTPNGPRRLDPHGDPLPPGALQRLGQVERLRQGGTVDAVALSPDGKVLASAGSQGAVYLWEVPAGKELRILTGHEGAVHALAFSPDGKLLVSAGADRTLRFWDPATGKLLFQWYTSAGVTRALAFSRDGKLLATGGDFHVRSVRVWVVATGLEVDQSFFHHAPVRAIAFSPDGKALVSGGDGGLLFWDAEAGRVQRSDAAQTGVRAVHFAPDGKTVIFGGTDGRVTFAAAATGKAVRQLDHGALVTGLSLSADGKRVASVGADSAVRIWDAQTGKPLKQLRVSADDPVQALTLSRDGQALVTGTRAGKVRYRGLNAGDAAPVGAERAEIHAVAITADGRTAATLEREVLRVWDAGTGKQLRVLAVGGPGRFRCVAFAPGGRLLAAGGGSMTENPAFGWVRLWETASGKLVRTLTLRDAPVLGLAFIEDGKNLASFGGDGKVHWWDAPTGAELRQFETGVRSAPVFALSPDGRTVACGSDKGPVAVWDAASGQKLGEVGRPAGSGVGLGFRLGQPEGRSLQGLAFAPDGRTLAVLRRDDAVRLYEVLTGEERRQVIGSARTAGAVELGTPVLAFSPDGRVLATGWRDVAVKFWDVASGAEIQQFGGHRHLVSALAFAASDGPPQTLVSASWDTTALVWNVRPMLQKQRTVRPRTAEGIAAAWNGLAGTDKGKAFGQLMPPTEATLAHDHLWALVGDPARSVPFLRGRLRPVSRPARSVEQMTTDLDSPRFPVREKAMAELILLGERIRPALTKALASSITLEVRRRLETILRKLDSSPIPAARLRALRAVEVLEYIGTAEARQILEALAGGDPEDQVTLEARASLRRLAHRPLSRPAAPKPPARSG